MTGRERVLTLLAGGRPDRPPVMPITMMFAAACAGVRYRDYAGDYRVLAEAQEKTAATFGFDHVSVISDPAREPAALGADIAWFDDQPPCPRAPLVAAKSVLDGLEIPDPLRAERMLDRVEAVRLLKEKAGQERVVEGWINGPSNAGTALRGIQALMLDFADDPQFIARLFEFAVEMELRFARAQVDAGADLIGIGESAASLAGPRFYTAAVHPYLDRLIRGIHAMGAYVRLHICGNIAALLPRLAEVSADILDLDSLVPAGHARRIVGERQILLGNLDPVRLLRRASPAEVAAAVRQCAEEAGHRYIAGAGCEITRDTPHENVRALACPAPAATR